MSDKKSIKEYVEDKIFTYTFHAKNFDKNDMDRVDSYCKTHFGNDRKKMILTLITLVEDNVNMSLMNDKINYITDNISNAFNEIDNRLRVLEKTEGESTKKTKWKGFNNKE